MKPLTRKQELLAALAEGRVPNITPLTAEEILLYEQAKREAASKNPKWEDIADKPFGSEEVVLIPEQEATFKFGAAGPVATIYCETVTPAKVGSTYRLTINGVTVESTYTIEDYYGRIEFKDEAFDNKIMYVRANPSNTAYDVVIHEEGTAVIEFSEVAVQPLDPTYLPKIAAVPDASGDTPTAAEFNALLAALRNAGYMAADTGL